MIPTLDRIVAGKAVHHEAVRCIMINFDTETAIGGRVSRTGCCNLITIEIAAEKASRGLHVREIVRHFSVPRKLAGRRAAATTHPQT
jgi:hypothetical protein